MTLNIGIYGIFSFIPMCGAADSVKRNLEDTTLWVDGIFLFSPR